MNLRILLNPMVCAYYFVHFQCPTMHIMATAVFQVTTHIHAGVYFIHNGQIYLNNSKISLQLIGENEDALICKTDLVECCGTRPNRFGEFYYPNGVRVPIRIRSNGFYRNRGKQEIRLHRNVGFVTPTGRFRCEIPDVSGVIQTAYIDLI